MDDYFGNTKEKHLGFPNVYKYNMVQTVKQAVQNHVTPVLPSLFGSNAFTTTYSAFIRRLKLPARSSGPSAVVFPARLSSSCKLGWGRGGAGRVGAVAPLAPRPAHWSPGPPSAPHCSRPARREAGPPRNVLARMPKLRVGAEMASSSPLCPP